MTTVDTRLSTAIRTLREATTQYRLGNTPDGKPAPSTAKLAGGLNASVTVALMDLENYAADLPREDA